MKRATQIEIARQQRKADFWFNVMLFVVVPPIGALILTWPL